MKTPDMRDYVCDMYQAFFDKEMRDKADLRFHEYLGQILAAARQGNVALGCWCAPLRCHGETIKAWLEAQITDVGREMTVDTLVDAILTQVRETGEWIVYTRAGVTVESLRYKDGKYIVHHPGQSDFSLGEESARRYVRAHRDAL
jgi:hypothetical protein